MTDQIQQCVTDEEAAAWFDEHVREAFLDTLACMRINNPKEIENWGFVKSALIIMADSAYGPATGTPGSRQLARMRRTMPFFLPKRGQR